MYRRVKKGAVPSSRKLYPRRREFSRSVVTRSQNQRRNSKRNNQR